MGMVWSIVNNLQMITHLPLLNLVFPSNTEFFLEMLSALSNFELIPAHDILKVIFPFLRSGDNDISDEDESDKDDLFGYSVNDFIDNTA